MDLKLCDGMLRTVEISLLRASMVPSNLIVCSVRSLNHSAETNLGLSQVEKVSGQNFRLR